MKQTTFGICLALTLAVTSVQTSSSFAAQAATAIPNLAGKILTVTGPIDPSEAGVALMHEHIYINFKTPMSAAGDWNQMTEEQQAVTRRVLAKSPKEWADKGGDPEWAKGFKPGWNTLDDFDVQLAEVMEFKIKGGGTIVDVGNFGLSRNPEFLKRISEASKLKVVMGAGWYQRKFHPRDMDARTVDELTDILVRDITVGAQGTNIRSGIIGEIGVEGGPLTDNEIKSTRASARASRITGAPMTFHVGGRTPEEKQRILDIVKEEGVDLNHVVMGHNFSGEVDKMKAITSRGAYIEFDALAWGPDSMKTETVDKLAQSIVNLINGGLTDRILIAQDICTQPQLKKNGGGGFAYIANYVLPALQAKGVSEETIRKIMVDNPRRALTFAAPQAAVKS